MYSNQVHSFFFRQNIHNIYLWAIILCYGEVRKSIEKGKHLGLRIEPDTHRKLKSLAKYEGRSMNGEVLHLIRRAISQHEKEYGPIDSDPTL